MQVQREVPEDMVCKDKFLIQSSVVRAETTSDEVTSNLFVKDGSKYIEENKLKVTLIRPPNSPHFSPINGDFKPGLEHGKIQIYSKDEIQSPEPMVLKNPDMGHEVLKLEEDMELRPDYYMGLDTMKDVEEPNEETSLKVSKDKELNMVKDVEVSKDVDLSNVKNAEEQKPEKATELKVSKVLDLDKVKNEEELKPEKEAGLKVSEIHNLNPVNTVKELKPGTELKMSTDLELKTVKNTKELKPEKGRELKLSEDMELKTLKNVEDLKLEEETELRVSKSIEELKLMKAIEEMKLKLDGLESKLNDETDLINKASMWWRLSASIYGGTYLCLLFASINFVYIWWHLSVSSFCIDQLCPTSICLHGGAYLCRLLGYRFLVAEV
ncbi:unnamed protein product [Sphenostylis stenocarpa]|uniref:Vesicle-associated protein 2-2 n=1 Tax=Sphenostylis stenocarpa TaxID=92480 RepID=A0AA86VPM9_9FABA|nr:unnamed protein product [Sphenostylis stenocarpa]